jgi:hypothetical protein
MKLSGGRNQGGAIGAGRRAAGRGQIRLNRMSVDPAIAFPGESGEYRLALARGRLEEDTALLWRALADPTRRRGGQPQCL